MHLVAARVSLVLLPEPCADQATSSYGTGPHYCSSYSCLILAPCSGYWFWLLVLAPLLGALLWCLILVAHFCASPWSLNLAPCFSPDSTSMYCGTLLDLVARFAPCACRCCMWCCALFRWRPRSDGDLRVKATDKSEIVIFPLKVHMFVYAVHTSNAKKSPKIYFHYYQSLRKKLHVGICKLLRNDFTVLAKSKEQEISIKLTSKRQEDKQTVASGSGNDSVGKEIARHCF